MDNKYYSITALNRAIKNMFEREPALLDIYIKGEISNFKHHTRGHFYFTLKDETSRIAAVMFNGYAAKINFEPVDGMKVLVHGRVSVYEANGGYQIYVTEMSEDGIGNLYLEYEKLKKKLNEEGLFDPSHKKNIPKFPKTIGIITAPTGAAIRDILSTIKRRYPICKTILFPALVQGATAKDSIVKQLKLAENYDLDVIICGRGGGSIEDLWAFNEECVAREIFACKIPIISAVGHEVDFTIADFVADLRAPTPTGAAEMAVPNLSDINNLLNQYQIRANEGINNYIKKIRVQYESIKESFVLKNPMSMYEVKEQKLDNFVDVLNKNIKNTLDNYTIRLDNIKNNYVIKNPESLFEKIEHQYIMLVNTLKLVNPLNILSKGYSIISINDNVIKESTSLKKDDIIDIRLHQGKLKAKVIEKSDVNEK